MENKNNSNVKILTTLVMILVVLVLCLGGYLVYDKLSSDDKQVTNLESVENNNTGITQYDISRATSLIESVVDKYDSQLIHFILEEGLSEEIKLLMAIKNTQPTKTYECSQLFDANYYGNYRPTNNEKWECTFGDKPDVYLYDSVSKEYSKIFGISKVAPKIDVFKATGYSYSSKQNAYANLQIQATGLSHPAYYEVESANIENDKLKINISYLLYKCDTLGCENHIYSVNNVEKTSSSSIDISQIYQQNKQELPKLTFVYELENNNYILTSIEK